MRRYFSSREEFVLYVNAALQDLKPGSVSTMTIIPGQFEDFSVRIVTEELLADTDKTKEQSSSEVPMSILQLPTQAG